MFKLPCGHEVEWRFSVFDVISRRVSCRVCLILDIQHRLSPKEDS